MNKRNAKWNRMDTRWRRKNKRWNKEGRYSEYYQKVMDPIWTERWETYLKRLKKLKKEVLKIGSIPTKENQLIKTTNCFVKFIDLLTSFLDNGILECAPEGKAQAIINFNDMLDAFVARKNCTICYINKSERGQRVNVNNLYIGIFNLITDKDDLNNIQTKNINGKKLRVDVDFTPLSEWLNGRVRTPDGHQAKLSQRVLAKFLNEMKSIVLELIDEILKE